MHWQPEFTPKIERPRGLSWFRVFWRLLKISIVMFGLLGPVMFARAFGFYQIAARIVKFASGQVLRILRFEIRVTGDAINGAGFIAANHSSWLDIYVVNGSCTAYFVAKSEVRTWPMIGLFARAVGTSFVERRSVKVRRQKNALVNRIANGECLLIFPEGTSTDGRRVLPFRSSLFEAVMETKDQPNVAVQGLSICYRAPPEKREDFYGWFGDMGFLASFLDVLAQPKNGLVELHFHRPLDLKKVSDRKELATLLENQVRTGFKALQSN
ncbi:MAG: lysophospholipid acyltransferase family protein [Pseudomonadota bacterium]